MAILRPENMNFSNKNIIMIISGLPGTGKTTLALSAPDVLLIDTDEGLARVNPAHRRDASVCKTYEEILADIKTAEGQYKTIVIDTCGKLIDYMKDWVVRHPEMFPKGAKTSGGISLQGFGFVKQEFIRLSDELAQKFNVIYLFHETLTKQDEGGFYELLVEGAARTVVWQPADLGAHLFIMNGKRYLGFTPTEQYRMIRTLAKLKTARAALREGGWKFLYAKDRIVVLARFTREEAFAAVLSTDSEEKTIPLPLGAIGASGFKGDVFGAELNCRTLDENAVELTVPAHQAYFMECLLK